VRFDDEKGLLESAGFTLAGAVVIGLDEEISILKL
jgi:hypothetical protein